MPSRRDIGEGPGVRCGARLSHGRGYCRAWALKGRRRCRHHGGKSTGPRTPEGRARTLTAMWWDRKRMIESLHAMGLKAPGWRKGMPSNRCCQNDMACLIEYV